MKIETSGVNLAGILGIIAVFLLLYVGWIFREYLLSAVQPSVVTDQGRITLPATTTPAVPNPTVAPSVEARGAYIIYNEAALSSVNENVRVVLFFTRQDCESCFLFEESVLALEHTIPPDVLLMRVGWSEQTALRRQYDVSIPHTFLEITTTGEVVQRWTRSTSLPSFITQLTRGQ